MADRPDQPDSSNGSTDTMRVGQAKPAVSRRLDPGHVADWLKGELATDRVVSFFKTLLWVAPLTILIWVYAERQQQVKKPLVTIPIEVESDASNYREIITPADRNIVVTVKGPKGAVDRIQQLFNNRPIKLTLDKAVTSGGVKQIQTIRVGQDPRFADAGITIESAQPDTISVMVEGYQDEDVPIQPRVRDPSREVTFEPATVKVRAPRSKLDALKKLTGGVLVAYADLPPVSQTADNDTVLRDVKITLPMTDPAVTFQPAAVSAKIKATGMVEYTPDNVLLRVAATDQVLRDYDIAALPPLHSPAVKLVGPREEIEKLQGGPAPRAFVELRPNVMPGENEADIHYDFGNRITIKEAPTTVKVTLTPRR